MFDTENVNELGPLLREGNHKAFMQLYDHYVDGLFNFIKKYISNEEVIEDIIHDSFYNLWKYRHNIKQNRSIHGYLYRIVRNEVYKAIRKHVQQKGMLNLYAEKKRGVVEESAHQWVVEGELDEIYGLAIDKLPPQRKRIFRMCREQGLSHKEIAQHLNISPNTVKEHMSLAMRTIKEYLAKDHDLIFAVLILSFLPH